MPLDQIANFVRGQTDAAVDSTQTTISVVDAGIFPDPANGEYNLVLWDAGAHPRPDQDPDVEIVRVTGRDTTNNDLTVTRGQEATVGAAHPSGSALQLSPTAALFGDVAATDATVENFTTDGAAGTSPVAQADGTLAMDVAGEPNVPAWEEDANSPHSVTGVSSTTYNMSKSYDYIAIVADPSNTGFNEIQFNGVTTGYFYRKNDGTTTTSASQIAIGSAYERTMMTLKVSFNIGIHNPLSTPNTSYGVWGRCTDAGAPLSEFTLKDSNGDLRDTTIRVYGLNV